MWQWQCVCHLSITLGEFPIELFGRQVLRGAAVRVHEAISVGLGGKSEIHKLTVPILVQHDVFRLGFMRREIDSAFGIWG
jgi:hypothetical protein